MADTTSPTPTRRAWTRALLTGLALLALVLALVLAGSAAWVARTESGTAWLLSHVLSLSGTSGRLFGGPFSAERTELKLGPRTLTVHGLAWQDATWSWRPNDSAWVGLVLVSPRAERIELKSSGSDEPLAPPTSLRLPLTLVLQDLRIGALHIDGVTPITQIAGSATLGAREGTEHRVDTLAFSWDRSRVQAKGTLASDTPFSLDLQADARSQEGSAPAWQASASARGPLERLAVQARLGSDRAPGATLRAEAAVQPFATWPLSTLSATMQELDLSALGSELPKTRLSGRADIDTRSLDAPIAVRIALTNADAGRWDQQRLPLTRLDIEFAGQARDRSRLDAKALALELLPGAGRIEGSGAWSAGTAQLALRLQGVR